MTFQTAAQQLTGRNQERRKLGNNTYLERRNENIVVRLHDTAVVIFQPNGDIKLETGGWKTVTTKERINSYLPRPWQVWSERGVWLLSDGNGTKVTFEDGITIKADGTIDGAGEPIKDLNKLKRQIKVYVEAYIAAFDAGTIPQPGPGDCWGCLMVTAEGKAPMGGKDHILSHFEKKYYVPSLLLRAIERYPVSQFARAYISDKWAGTNNGAVFAPVGRDQVAKSLRRYINQELGMQG